MPLPPRRSPPSSQNLTSEASGLAGSVHGQAHPGKTPTPPASLCSKGGQSMARCAEEFGLPSLLGRPPPVRSPPAAPPGWAWMDGAPCEGGTVGGGRLWLSCSPLEAAAEKPGRDFFVWGRNAGRRRRRREEEGDGALRPSGMQLMLEPNNDFNQVSRAGGGEGGEGASWIPSSW